MRFCARIKVQNNNVSTRSWNLKETAIFSYIISFLGMFCVLVTGVLLLAPSVLSLLLLNIIYLHLLFRMFFSHTLCLLPFFIIWPGPKVHIQFYGYYSGESFIQWRRIEEIFTGEKDKMHSNIDRKKLKNKDEKMEHFYALYWILRTNIFFCSLLFLAFDSQFGRKSSFFVF